MSLNEENMKKGLQNNDKNNSGFKMEESISSSSLNENKNNKEIHDNLGYESDSSTGKKLKQIKKDDDSQNNLPKSPQKIVGNTPITGYVESKEWEDMKLSNNGLVPSMPEEEIQISNPPSPFESETQEKRAILKNIIILSISFVFLFTAYNSMANLQSTINEKMGTASLSTLYGALVVSCFFVPSLMIQTLKEKVTIAVSMLGYSLYIAAQFYPRYYTLIPAAIVLGLGAAPMWSAKCKYLTTVGIRYAKLAGENNEVIITRFFGIFFLFFQSTQIWGNLIASLILSTDKVEILANDTNLEYCGREFCPWDQGEKKDEDTKDEEDDKLTTQLYIMSSIYLAFALLSSVIILLLLDPLSKFQDQESTSETSSPKSLILATLHQMKHPYQILIIPLTMWSGVEQAFIGADFTAAFISCGYGVYMVGYIMILYGVCDALVSYGFTPIVKYVGRVPVFIFGALCNSLMIAIMLLWMPKPEDNIEFYFIVAAFWGVGDAIWQTQINAFYGVIFPGKSEAAFSNYRLWESVGFIIAYICSTLICTDAKIFILIGFLVAGMIGYFVIEILEYQKAQSKGIGTRLTLPK